ncbi:Ca2+-transporting ATPase [Caldanaerobacter subterraneus subsp. tengcongensis MB4]|uniref:P-type Ca(2+) transporter n=1 Tax=Caldanaerobacter subterraneus subsp. tengcongensis (strain DSM 15242 / JCM 11007 / NBRC 100824 / MB4) TaxID=273068 RepID=Q8RBR6_CALS4|nr:calcium-translocating P-type ATPase, SERCA-type [Caldanaerobacter subterraneus]AAM24007.1 Cation transport ATPases [Caldanaerobacter subterraneus subsp. tengcongensis MB4]MCS3916473.1 Ca2+-transporting ATPase [Caldanaerobacter subterraneus subsp. tengcongensis MB4]
MAKGTSQQTIYYLDKINFKGLTSQEAQKRLLKYGPNVLEEGGRISPIQIFLNQFQDFMVMVLLAATLISTLMGELADALTITVIVILNAILGFVQEYKTEKSLEALKKLAAPSAKVLRDGEEKEVEASQIVIDDVILLGAGDKVPADALLIEAHNLEVDESILTGESVPVHKEAPLNLNRTVVESRNMVYMGTVVTKGKGKAVVTATGMQTEMGKIAGMMKEIEGEETPLQKRLNKLGKVLVVLALFICGVVTVMGIIRGEPIYYMFLSGVSLAVAAIPEGLPAVVTISLAIGVQRMLKRNALIRKLPAVETLGCTNVICTDKTGTLTENKMTVTKVFCDEEVFDVRGKENEELIKKKNISRSALRKMLEIGALCNNVKIKKESIKIGREVLEEDKYIGDPTEAAIFSFSLKSGISQDFLNKIKRIEEIPFDSERKRMTVIVEIDGEKYAYTKGAPDVILELCSFKYVNGKEVPLTPFDKKRVLDVNESFGKEALRVLAFAYKKLPPKSPIIAEFVERNLVFVGLEGMIDPPRKEVYDAVLKCKMAGIKPVMITGDHKVTATAIAKELNILGEGERVITGKDLDEMTDKELEKTCTNVSVYARVTPKHKYRIVRALKNRGFTVAMTGDGVNDAPALKEADIGIAMGKGGTEVAKEASSMILLDDNFATIVAAVEEGRIIYDNIKKFIRFLLSCNFGEVLTMFFAALMSLKLPLVPIQILMVNLVTDGLPALALGLDPPEKDIMRMKPRDANESVFSRGLGLRIFIVGVLIGISTVGAYVFALGYAGLEKARTIAFATLVTVEMIHAFECRSERHLIFELGFFTNPYLVLAVLSSFLIFLSTVYIKPLGVIFKTVPLDAYDWLVVVFFSSIEFVFNNLYTAYIIPHLRKEE